MTESADHDLQDRLARLRSALPNVIIAIDALRLDDALIALKATIAVQNGGSASATAAVEVEDQSWPDVLERVETRALTRALDRFGELPARPSQRSTGASTPTAPMTGATTQSESSARAGASAETGPEGDEHAAEYSWTMFWTAAKQAGITREDIEAALGKPVQSVSPREAVAAMRDQGRWPD